MQIDDKTIFDTTTGILYTLSEGWNFGQTYDEAKKDGSLFPRVYITSAHAPDNTTDILIEKQSALYFWERLVKQATK